MITIPGIDPTMIANNLNPFYPTHPGQVLKDEIEFRGISQRRLAAEMGVSYTLLNEVLNAKRPVNAELALLFEAALGLDAEPLLKMQARYTMQIIKRNKTFSDRLAKIRQTASIL